MKCTHDWCMCLAHYVFPFRTTNTLIAKLYVMLPLVESRRLRRCLFLEQGICNRCGRIMVVLQGDIYNEIPERSDGLG